MCMVQTKEQYNFIYKVLQDELADDSGSSDMDSSGSSTTDSEMEEISNASLCTGGSKNFSPKVIDKIYYIFVQALENFHFVVNHVHF